MIDRSIQAQDISQSVVVTGDGNTVSLRFGETGIILPLKRKQFRPPVRRRKPAPEERPRELDLLIPEAGKLDFVGRKDLLAELRIWLDDEPDISVHALIGRAGTGKTRLALELCKAIDSDFAAKGTWIAGFLSPGDLTPVVETLATRNFAWERQTLLVIDYAAQCHSALGRWLDRLAYQKLETKLRILLLDREAPEGFGWWHELTSPSLRDQAVRLDLFYVPRPKQLPDLSAPEERRKLMSAAFEAASALRHPPTALPCVPAAGADVDFDARLADRQFGNPLNLVMAGVIARDRGPHAALALRHLDAARQLGGRELDRLAKLAECRGLNGDMMRYIVAFNGLAGGLPCAGLRKILSDELIASQRTTEIDVLLELLQQELPSDTGRPVEHQRLAAIQPDLIGEATIIVAFTRQPTQEAEAPAAVRRAYALSQDAAAQALMRLVQDFGYAVEDKSATEGEKKTGQRVIDWLLTLADNIEDPIQMIPLVNALPVETTVLLEAAAELTQRLTAFLRREAERSKDPGAISHAALMSQNLAVRLGALGRREEAMDAADVAVRLYRGLAEVSPDAFAPGLALALTNHATRLSDLGRREDALPPAEEAVRLRRALAEARPDAFTRDLAASLNNLANRLKDLGQREKGLLAADEAVRLYRRLAEPNPDAFMPDLALSLNTLAAMLSAPGGRKDALDAAEEAVRLHRRLAEANPDAFTPGLALSLTNLADMLSDFNWPEDALAAADEAVRLRRALAAAEEAVHLRRILAGARPDAFTLDLARSLKVLTNLYCYDLDPEHALSMLREGIQSLTPMLAPSPGAVGELMTWFVYSYIAQSKFHGREPDEALLAPVLQVFEDLTPMEDNHEFHPRRPVGQSTRHHGKQCGDRGQQPGLDKHETIHAAPARNS